ncbi:YdcH family protein [Paracoccaceae bacterium GXU_MW_L88]
MSVENHISKLHEKHTELSDRVEAIQRSPGSSDAEIAELKKQKLKIKEEITRLEGAG